MATLVGCNGMVFEVSVDGDVRELSIRRIAKVFGVSRFVLHETDRFGFELLASGRCDFRRNEYDVVNDDIRDVADKNVLKELERGDLAICSVGDYCEHMIRCHRLRPEEVEYVLGQSI